MNKVLISGVLGGCVVFVWGMISWMVLPWHQPAFKSFQYENLVQEAVLVNAKEPGIYLLPKCDKDKTKSREEQKAQMKEAHAKMEQGPFMFAVVRPSGLGKMQNIMFRGFIFQCLTGILIALILFRVKIKKYSERLLFISLLALLLGLMAHIQNWNWWGFPTYYTVIGILDVFVGWFLAGIVMSKTSA